MVRRSRTRRVDRRNELCVPLQGLLPVACWIRRIGTMGWWGRFLCYLQKQGTFRS